MYRAGLEAILGVRVRGARLIVDPCIPRAWPGFTIAFRFHSTQYTIVVDNPHGAGRGASSVELDGVAVTGPPGIPLVDDGTPHHVRIVLGGH
jgi:cyclic beta-1,2-glucan synthetase